MKTSRGFTLIELLVVVAIIGVLVSAVLVSVSASKGRGNDTAVKSNLATIQVQGVLYYGLGNTYGATNTGSGASCTASGTLFKDTTTTVEDIIGNSVTAAIKAAQGGTVVCRSTSTAFLVAAQTSNGKYWCVDSVGHAVEEASQPGNTTTVCP